MTVQKGEVEVEEDLALLKYLPESFRARQEILYELLERRSRRSAPAKKTPGRLVCDVVMYQADISEEYINVHLSHPRHYGVLHSSSMSSSTVC